MQKVAGTHSYSMFSFKHIHHTGDDRSVVKGTGTVSRSCLVGAQYIGAIPPGLEWLVYPSCIATLQAPSSLSVRLAWN